MITNNPDPSAIAIRAIESPRELDACLDLQEMTWGQDFSELVPPGVLKIVQKVGGIAAGAFDEADQLVGFVFGISGVRNKKPAHWSHMLAVVPGHMNTGLGRKLKEYQRRRLLELEIGRMYWTFDPLVARNAHFNINRLGVTIEQYVKDMYGEGDRGKLDSIIGTDRFIADWDLLAGKPRRPITAPDSVKTVNSVLTDGLPSPTPLRQTEDNTIFVEIPQDIEEIKLDSPDRARDWRKSTREALGTYIASGYRVTGFARLPDTHRCLYELRRGSGR